MLTFRINFKRSSLRLLPLEAKAMTKEAACWTHSLAGCVTVPENPQACSDDLFGEHGLGPAPHNVDHGDRPQVGSCWHQRQISELAQPDKGRGR